LQPQNKIFQLFDSLLVMARGRILYQGSPSEVLRYYERAGFPLPPLTNPADHLLDVISSGENEERLFLAARLEGQAAATANGAALAPPADSLPEIARESDSSISGVSIPLQRIHRADDGPRDFDVAFPGAARKFHPRRWLLQYVTLFKRSAKEQTRQWRTMMVQLVQNVVMALLIGAVFFQVCSIYLCVCFHEVMPRVDLVHLLGMVASLRCMTILLTFKPLLLTFCRSAPHKAASSAGSQFSSSASSTRASSVRLC
jgi:hypothetical protein